jgi:preprotein translocase subunit SecG
MIEFLSKPLTVLHVMACLFIILVVLLQPGKGGGMGAFTGAAATQVFGGRGAGNILTKVTWTTAAIFFLTSVGLAYLAGAPSDTLANRGDKAKTSKQQTTPPVSPAKPAK